MCPRLPGVGPFSIPTYGLLVAAGFLVGLWISARLARRSGLDPDRITNLGVYLALAAIVGAKVFMIATHLPYYLEDPGRIFSWSSLQAGGVFYGGLLAALATAIFYSRRAGLPALETADVFAPGVAVGHSIGRLGCFAAGCCWGKPTSLPWAVVFTDPAAHEYVGVPLNIHLHPTQLYEAAGTLVIGLILLARFRVPRPPGTVLALYLVLYPAFRFGVEFLRAESERSFPFGGPLSATQAVGIVLGIAGLLMLSRLKGQAAEGTGSSRS